MKLQEVVQLDELSYPGNVGAMEMFRFYQVATEEQKAEMKKLIKHGKSDEAWELLQKVVKTKLK